MIAGRSCINATGPHVGAVGLRTPSCEYLARRAVLHSEQNSLIGPFGPLFFVLVTKCLHQRNRQDRSQFDLVPLEDHFTRAQEDVSGYGVTSHRLNPQYRR